MKLMVRNAIAAIVLAGIFLPAIAQGTEPDDAIKYRKWTMGTVGNHMQAFVAILQGKVSHQDAIGYHAEALALAAAQAKSAFEQNTAGQGTEETTAKDTIWDGPDFNARLGALEEATAALSEVVRSGEMAAVGGALGEVGKNCKGCHDTFREEHAH